jgi:hypothetical protein
MGIQTTATPNASATSQRTGRASRSRIFIYESVILIAAYSLGSFDARDILRVGFLFAVVQCILMALLIPLYWPLIGI